jgi:hypothetical protein
VHLEARLYLAYRDDIKSWSFYSSIDIASRNVKQGVPYFMLREPVVSVEKIN